MKRARCCLLFLLLLSMSPPASALLPDTLWTRTYGGLSHDFGKSVQATVDGGFIITGSISVEEDLNADYIYLVRTDSTGDTLWTRTYNKGIGRKVRQTTDGGFIIAANAVNIPDERDVCVIKTDSAGDTLWTFNYIGAGDDCAADIIQMSDGGFLAGITTDSGENGLDWMLLKLDAEGATEWYRIYGGPEADRLNAIVQAPDGGIYAAGSTNNWNAQLEDACLMKTGSEGVFHWGRTWGDAGQDRFNSLALTSDGGLILAGSSDSWGPGEAAYLVKVNADGEREWWNYYELRDEDSAFGVRETWDGGFLLAGDSRLTGSEDDLFLLKTTTGGVLEWSWFFGGDQAEHCAGLVYAPEGGYAIVGQTGSFGNGGNDALLLQTEPLLELSAALQDSPVVIPRAGGAFEYTAHLENNTPGNVRFDYWFELVFPNSRRFSYLLEESVTLAAGEAMDTLLVQTIPFYLHAGTYTYIVKIGRYPGRVVSQDELEFQKSPGQAVSTIPDADIGEWSASDWEAGVSDLGASGWNIETGERDVGSEDQTGQFSADAPNLANGFSISEVYPNPFNSTVQIGYRLVAPAEVRLAIFNVIGREVAVLDQGHKISGTYRVAWDAREMATGVYVALLQANDERIATKILLLR